MRAPWRSNVGWLLLTVVLTVWFFHRGSPGWAVVSGALAVLATVSLVALYRADRRTARTNRGCCGECGYDLRSTPHRCPECGHVPPHGVRLEFGDWLKAEFSELQQHPPSDEGNRGATAPQALGRTADERRPVANDHARDQGLDIPHAPDNNPPM